MWTVQQTQHNTIEQTKNTKNKHNGKGRKDEYQE
jgi:hypothetical protein